MKWRVANDHKNIKVLAVSTSPRKKKNTQELVEAALSGCQSTGAETELICVSDLEMKPCIGCKVCQKTGKCHIKDGIAAVLKKMVEADVILIGSPVFFYNITAQCKMIIDRSHAVQPLNGNKVGGMLITAGSMGSTEAINSLNMFLTVHGITSAGYVSSLGYSIENPKALESARELGMKAVKMATALKDAPACFDMHDHFAYGTHTK